MRDVMPRVAALLIAAVAAVGAALAWQAGDRVASVATGSAGLNVVVLAWRLGAVLSVVMATTVAAWALLPAPARQEHARRKAIGVRLLALGIIVPLLALFAAGLLGATGRSGWAQAAVAALLWVALGFFLAAFVGLGLIAASRAPVPPEDPEVEEAVHAIEDAGRSPEPSVLLDPPRSPLPWENH